MTSQTSQTKPRLFIGNKNYSSWSMRPWLALRWGGIAFDETVIPLLQGAAKTTAIRAVSPTGKVPVLVTDGVTIYDSLAIGLWAAEQAPSLLPTDPLVRALGWSAIAEMHAGFQALRRDLSMNMRRRVVVKAFADDVTADIARVTELWTSLRARHAHSGPWLLGTRSLADAFYAPVVTRFRTYGVPLTSTMQAYAETVLGDSDVLAWERDAIAETWTMPGTDSLFG